MPASRPDHAFFEDTPEGEPTKEPELPPDLAARVAVVRKLLKQARKEAERKDKKRLNTLAEQSGLSLEELAELEKRQYVHERLVQNYWEGELLAEHTLQAIQVMVDLLAEELPPDQKEQIFQAVGLQEKIGFGAFYNTHPLGETGLVVKEIRLNYLFDMPQAVQMLARHELEARRLREYFYEMIPNFQFVVPEDQKEVFDAEIGRLKLPAEEKEKLYPWVTFFKIQADRRMQTEYKRHGIVQEKRQGVDKVWGVVGELLRDKKVVRGNTAGVMVEGRVRGITFAEFLEPGKFYHGNCPNYEAVKDSVRLFIRRCRLFNEKYALMLGRLDSDNVLLEVDKFGQPTGQIKIVDLNFTEKSSEWLRRLLVEKFNKKILQPLEEKFYL